MSNTENKQGRLKGAQKNPIAHKMRQSSTNVVDVPGQKSEEFNRLASEVEETNSSPAADSRSEPGPAHLMRL